MRVILLAVICCALSGCGPGILAAATALSGFDAAENLLHDGPDLFECGHLLAFKACPKDDGKASATSSQDKN